MVAVFLYRAGDAFTFEFSFVKARTLAEESLVLPGCKFKINWH